MVTYIVLWLLFGALIGWIAGKIMKTSLSLMWTIGLGIVGAVVGGFVASLIGLGSFAMGASFNFWNIVISVAGACLVVWLVGMMRREPHHNGR